MAEMNPSIYMVASNDPQAQHKLMSLAILNLLDVSQVSCFLIDTDIHNPVLFNTYYKHMPSIVLNLDNVDGWLKLIDICREHPERTIFINGTNSVLSQVEKYLKVLLKALPQLDRYFITFWIATGAIDIDVVNRYIKSTNGRVLHLIRCVNNWDDLEKYPHGKYVDNYIAEPTFRDIIEETGIFEDILNLSSKTIETILDRQIPLKEIRKDLHSKAHRGNRVQDEQWSDFCTWESHCRTIVNSANQAVTGFYTVRGLRGYDRFAEIETPDSWSSEDIGDLLAAGRMDIDYVCAEAVEKEESDSVGKIGTASYLAEQRRREAEFFMYETEQERAEREQKEARDRDFTEYRLGRSPAGFIPTAGELERIKRLNEPIPF